MSGATPTNFSTKKRSVPRYFKGTVYDGIKRGIEKYEALLLYNKSPKEWIGLHL